jgi:hypothetical protein
MPKQLKAHWIVRGVAVSLATLGIAVGWQASSGVDRTLGNPRVLEQSDFGWRQGELLFLKAALNRLDADAKQTDLDSPALRSLRAEQDAVMLRMREVAWPLPAESLPHELHFLVNDEPRAGGRTHYCAKHYDWRRDRSCRAEGRARLDLTCRRPRSVARSRAQLRHFDLAASPRH